jgi:hypothetical protein
MATYFSPTHPPIPHSPRGTGQRLYEVSRSRGRRGQFWSALTGGSRRLLDLRTITAGCTTRTEGQADLRAVPIGEILGSESRTGDFDCDFNPICDHNKQRWLSIAAIRQQGKNLPPVALVQVGDIYFVLDGHHRISVARALGQESIEARVVVWQINEWLPVQQPRHVPIHRRLGETAGLAGSVARLGNACRALKQCIVARLSGTATGIPRRETCPDESAILDTVHA